MTITILFASAIILLGLDARGDCMAPRSFIVPASKATLPPNPVMYVFVPSYKAIPTARIKSTDPNARVAISPVSQNDTFISYRLNVTLLSGDFEIEVSSDKKGSDLVWATAQYTIDPGVKPPAAPSVKTTLLGKERSAWTCSHNMTYNLEPSVPAMAYRLEWSTTPEDFAAGKRETALFPYSLDGFFDKQPQQGPPVIKLGHANCLGNTFEWPSASVYVGLVALHPDGSETPSVPEPVRVPWSFGGISYGAVTDAFYAEIHGTDRQGHPVGTPSSDGRLPTTPPQKPPTPPVTETAPFPVQQDGCTISDLGHSHRHIPLIQLLLRVLFT